MPSEDCQKEVWNKSFITTPEYILHGWVNFRIISHRTKKDPFSISIRYNNELFTSLVLSINSRIFFLSICVLLDGVIHVIFFFALWKAGMISLIVKQYAFVRSNGKSYYYSEQEKFGLISFQSPSLILDILLVKTLVLLKFLSLITCREILSVLRRPFRALINGKRLYSALFKIY